MATATISSPALSACLPEGVPYRMTADAFFRAVEADVFPPQCRLGLWEGQIYEKMAKKLPHFVSSAKLGRALWSVLPAGWFLSTENPILVDEFTAPLPDATVVRGAPDDYFRRRSVPKVGEIGLVIELADASLKKDRTIRLEKYARAGLPVYWVVNLVDQQIEIFEGPHVNEHGVGSYLQTGQFRSGQEVPLVLDGREVARIPVNALLPEETAP